MSLKCFSRLGGEAAVTETTAYFISSAPPPDIFFNTRLSHTCKHKALHDYVLDFVHFIG